MILCSLHSDLQNHDHGSFDFKSPKSRPWVMILWFILSNFPPGSKCEALRLGVHLILYFIWILVVGTEIIFYLDVGVGVGVGVGGGLFCL